MGSRSLGKNDDGLWAPRGGGGPARPPRGRPCLHRSAATQARYFPPSPIINFCQLRARLGSVDRTPAADCRAPAGGGGGRGAGSQRDWPAAPRRPPRPPRPPNRGPRRLWGGSGGGPPRRQQGDGRGSEIWPAPACARRVPPPRPAATRTRGGKGPRGGGGGGCAGRRAPPLVVLGFLGIYVDPTARAGQLSLRK